MKKSMVLLLAAIAVLTMTSASSQAQQKTCTAKAFFTSSNSMPLHYAFSRAAAACSDSAMQACNDRAVEIKEDCEFRNEGFGTGYASCRCQAYRYNSECYANA